MDGTLTLFILAASTMIVLLIFVLIRKSGKSSVPETEHKISIPNSGEGPIKSQGYLVVKDELRLLDIEREIAGYAIAYLNEAMEKGRITEEEKRKVEEKYNNEIRELDTKIERGKLVANLYEIIIQGTREDAFLMKPPTETVIKESIGERVSPKTETKETMKLTKTRADERLEKIRAEIRKALEKLERMDLEG